MRHQVQAAISTIVQRNIAQAAQPVPEILRKARVATLRPYQQAFVDSLLAEPAEPDTIEQALARARAAGF